MFETIEVYNVVDANTNETLCTFKDDCNAIIYCKYLERMTQKDLHVKRQNIMIFESIEAKISFDCSQIS